MTPDRGRTQVKRNEPIISMNGDPKFSISSSGAVQMNWKKSTVLPPSSAGAKKRPWSWLRSRPDLGAGSSTPRRYTMFVPKRTRRSISILASGDAAEIRSHVVLAATLKSTARATRSWLRSAFTQKPSTSLGVRTTARASGASSITQPRGTVKTKLGIGRIMRPGNTASRSFGAGSVAGWVEAPASVVSVMGESLIRISESAKAAPACPGGWDGRPGSQPGMLPVIRPPHLRTIATRRSSPVLGRCLEC